MQDAAHWQRIYHERDPQGLGWYQPRPAMSLALVEAAGCDAHAPLIDAGGGASSLVDHLLEADYRDLTVLDLSAAALARSRHRLGPRAAAVHWVEADVTAFRPERRYALWHDRAVLHFLVDAADRARYRDVLAGALAPGGQAVIGCFAPDGPAKCSGLPVHRYDAGTIVEVLGDGFELLETRRETHRTPGGAEQRYCWFRLRRSGG